MMFHTKFHQNRPTGSWKEDFFKYLYVHVYGHGSNLGHVTSIMLMNFDFLVPTKLQNLVENGPVISEKGKFQFSSKITLYQGQEMTLTFNTHFHLLN